jgi:class 3 adenylate cyclase/tetratricopeptide (TPR) repeat protein
MSWQCSACSATNPDGTAFCGQCGAASTAGLRTERRLVTALFADISGFSELTGRVDTEELLEVIDPVVAALGNVVGRFGGTVEKYAGDAILALFGAPVAHDDDAARALRTAEAMHRELAELVPELGPEAANLRLHIGVNSGHGIGRVMGSDVRLDYGVLGDVVVLAQRLEAAAPPGETYVGETTFELTRKQFDLEPLGELTVKGKEKPVPAWRLVGPRAGGGAAASVEPTLAGRERELASLGELVGRRAGVGFVVGEAGAGKTVLCQALRAHAESAGVQWLAARCLSYGGELAYWPFADLFRRLFGLADAPPADARALLQERLAELGLPEALPFVAALCGVEQEATEQDAQSFQVRLHESVVGVLREIAAREPTILHLDDLHWADGPTVALLRKVIGLCGETSLLVLVSTRPDALALVEELTSDGSIRIDLEPLAEEAVREIATSILGAPPAQELVEELVERTRGNPFFVEEVTRSLVERAELVERDGEWHTRPGWEADQVPLTVEGILAARIDSLAEPERDALEVLSIIGRRADGELARAVSGEIDVAVPTLVGAGLLDPPEETSYVLAFHHPLIQQVVYSRLLRRRRARLHSLVGEAAEELYGVDDASVDLFARHFYLGEEPHKAYPYLLRAADRAERLFANEQALTQLRRALELTDIVSTTRARLDLLHRCARLEETVGRYEEALRLYHEVAEAGDFRGWIGEAAMLRTLGRLSEDEALARLDQAREAFPDPEPSEIAALAMEEGQLLRMRGDLRGGAQAFERAIAAVAGQDLALEGELLGLLGYTLSLIGSAQDGLPQALRAREIFERTGDLPRLALTLRTLGGIQSDLAVAEDDRAGLEQARATLEQAQSLAHRVGNAEEQAASLINLAVVLDQLGEYEAALEADREALAAFDSVGLKPGVACAWCNLADHLTDLERWEEALDAARHGLAVAREVDMPFWITGALVGIAYSELGLGNFGAAAEAAEEAAEIALAHGLARRTEWALRYAIEAHEGLGNRERVEELRQQADELGYALPTE